MILEVQLQTFGVRAEKFTFSKNSWGLKYLIFFCENRHDASFFIL